jgi:isocitrate dehydrogenase
MKTAADIMRSPVVRVSAAATAADALAAMRENRVPCVLVEPEHEDDAYGFFSQTDAVAKIVAAQVDPAKVRLGDVMTKPVITVPPDTSVLDCALVMHKSHIHRVLVHDGDNIVGLVSASDVLGIRRA